MGTRYLDPTNDVAFKKLFSNKEMLMSLLNAILQLKDGRKIKELDYIPVEQMPLFIDGKRSIFDLKVKDEAGLWYIIEMQRKMEKDYLSRAQLYGCHSYVMQIEKGMEHRDLLPIIIISIIGTRALPKELPCINYHHLKETTTGKQYLFSQTYVFVELGKFDDTNIKTDTDQWLHLLKYATKEQKPPEDIDNQEVLCAYSSLEKYKWSAQEYDDYFRCEMAMQQEANKLEEALKKGMAKGIRAGRKEGLKTGREEGIKEGIKTGKEEGVKDGKIEIAKEMLLNNEPLEKIIRFTKLTIEDIEKIKACL